MFEQARGDGGGDSGYLRLLMGMAASAAIALEVRLAVNAVQEATEILAALAGAVLQAERLVFLAEKGFELGAKRHLDVQDAQVNLHAAKSSLARAQRDYHVARVTLAWAEGTLDAGVRTP